MIGLGIFVLVVVGLASLAVVLRGGYPVRIDVHWFTIKTSVGVVFLAGAVALALVVFGLSLLYEGLKRGHRRRKETKDLRKRANANETAAAASSGGTAQATPPPGAGTSPGVGSTSPAAGSTPVRGSSEAGTRSAGPDDHFDTAPRER
jgi:hypothetical protein